MVRGAPFGPRGGGRLATPRARHGRRRPRAPVAEPANAGSGLFVTARTEPPELLGRRLVSNGRRARLSPHPWATERLGLLPTFSDSPAWPAPTRPLVPDDGGRDREHRVRRRNRRLLRTRTTALFGDDRKGERAVRRLLSDELRVLDDLSREPRAGRARAGAACRSPRPLDVERIRGRRRRTGAAGRDLLRTPSLRYRGRSRACRTCAWTGNRGGACPGRDSRELSPLSRVGSQQRVRMESVSGCVGQVFRARRFRPR